MKEKYSIYSIFDVYTTIFRKDQPFISKVIPLLQ